MTRPDPTEERPNAADWRNRAERAEAECAELLSSASRLVVASRIVWEQVEFGALPDADQTKALDKALEPFSSRVPYDDQPDHIGDANEMVPTESTGDVEKVARAICQSKDLSPDSLYQHDFEGDWPEDERREYTDSFTGKPRVQLFHRAWRRWDKAARAAIAAMQPRSGEAVQEDWEATHRYCVKQWDSERETMLTKIIDLRAQLGLKPDGAPAEPASGAGEPVACSTCKGLRYLIAAPSTCSAGGELIPCPSCTGACFVPAAEVERLREALKQAAVDLQLTPGTNRNGAIVQHVKESRERIRQALTASTGGEA